MRSTGKKSSRRFRGAPAALLVLLLIVSAGFLFAGFYMDGGHDIVISQDTFDVRMKVNYDGKLCEAEDGIVTINKTEGFHSGEKLPLTIDIYYKGESYAYIRMMMVEQWLGTYTETVSSADEKEGILPEPLMGLSLNTDIAMADNRSTDGYIYLTKVQTTLTAEQADSMWEKQEELLQTREEGEALYKEDGNGGFTEAADGEWKKLTILAADSVTLPQFTDEADSVNNAVVKTLKLYLKTDAVQFNRFETLWNIPDIPARTNMPDETEENGN